MECAVHSVMHGGHLAFFGKADDDGFRGSEALQAKQQKKNEENNGAGKRNFAYSNVCNARIQI